MRGGATPTATWAGDDALAATLDSPNRNEACDLTRSVSRTLRTAATGGRAEMGHSADRHLVVAGVAAPAIAAS